MFTIFSRLELGFTLLLIFIRYFIQRAFPRKKNCIFQQKYCKISAGGSGENLNEIYGNIFYFVNSFDYAFILIHN